MTDAIKALREARDAWCAIEHGGSVHDARRLCCAFVATHADTILALLESREAAARAVVWAYDEWERIESFDKPMPIRAQGAHLVSAEVVRLATGKHPRDWTRPALMAHLGLTDGPTR